MSVAAAARGSMMGCEGGGGNRATSFVQDRIEGTCGSGGGEGNLQESVVIVVKVRRNLHRAAVLVSTAVNKSLPSDKVYRCGLSRF